MNTSNLNWAMAFFTILVLVVNFSIEIGGVTVVNNFDTVARMSVVVIAEVFFFGVFFGMYEKSFFKTSLDSIFIIPFLAFALTSIFYFIQESIFFTYFTWIVWILAITWGQSYVIIEGNSEKGLWNSFFTLIIVLWITGFSFLALGALPSLGFHFSDNIYAQIPILRWTLHVKTILTIVVAAAIIIKPAFSMTWKLDKGDVHLSRKHISFDRNMFDVIVDAITNAVKRAGDYLNNVRLNLRTLLSRYKRHLWLTLREISVRTYSIFLMTVSLVSVLFISKISDAQSPYLYSLIKSTSLSDQGYNFAFTMLYAFCLYCLLILNWFLFSMGFRIKSLQDVKETIWEVITSKSEILIVNIPGVIFLMALTTWIAVAVFNFISGNPFIFPGIYLLICIVIIISFVVYRKFVPASSQNSG